MNWTFSFFLNSVLLGVGLAMDAFSVSIANGLKESGMPRNRMRLIAGTFGGFQALMPMLGWALVHTLLYIFKGLQRWIPWIALLLLVYLGGRMILESLRGGEAETAQTSGATLFLQGVATSIDALSVGLTIAEYDIWHALCASLIIAAVTYGICMGGLLFGKTVGIRFSRFAPLLGGLILIGIGIEIFVSALI